MLPDKELILQLPKYQSNWHPIGCYSQLKLSMDTLHERRYCPRICITSVLASFWNAFGYLHGKYGVQESDFEKFENADSYGVWTEEMLDGKLSIRLQPLGFRFSPSLCVFEIDEHRGVIKTGLLGVYRSQNGSMRSIGEKELFELGTSDSVAINPPGPDFLTRKICSKL